MSRFLITFAVGLGATAAACTFAALPANLSSPLPSRLLPLTRASRGVQDPAKRHAIPAVPGLFGGLTIS